MTEDARRFHLYSMDLMGLVGAVRSAQGRAQMVAWAAEHGSQRLRDSIELGVDATRLYEDERLAVERPGWLADLGA